MPCAYMRVCKFEWEIVGNKVKGGSAEQNSVLSLRWDELFPKSAPLSKPRVIIKVIADTQKAHFKYRPPQ